MNSQRDSMPVAFSFMLKQIECFTRCRLVRGIPPELMLLEFSRTGWTWKWSGADANRSRFSLTPVDALSPWWHSGPGVSCLHRVHRHCLKNRTAGCWNFADFASSWSNNPVMITSQSTVMYPGVGRFLWPHTPLQRLLCSAAQHRQIVQKGELWGKTKFDLFVWDHEQVSEINPEHLSSEGSQLSDFLWNLCKPGWFHGVFCLFPRSGFTTFLFPKIQPHLT